MVLPSTTEYGVGEAMLEVFRDMITDAEIPVAAGSQDRSEDEIWACERHSAIFLLVTPRLGQGTAYPRH